MRTYKGTRAQMIMHKVISEGNNAIVAYNGAIGVNAHNAPPANNNENNNVQEGQESAGDNVEGGGIGSDEGEASDEESDEESVVDGEEEGGAPLPPLTLADLQLGQEIEVYDWGRWWKCTVHEIRARVVRCSYIDAEWADRLLVLGRNEECILGRRGQYCTWD